MRIAIAAMDGTGSAEVCARAARAPFFLIYDGDGELREVVSNPFDTRERAVGVRMADYLAEKGIDTVIAGHFGPNFADALSAKGMRRLEMRGTVGDIAARVASGAP